MSGGDLRQYEAADGHSVGEVQRTDLGEHLQPDGVVVFNRPGKLELYPERLELYVDGGLPLRPRHDRVRQLAARQELCRFTARSQQIGLGQDLQNIVLLQGPYGRAKINITTEKKN